ncbi:AMP deaminase [Naganishia cerealis]|uniref:AMP deaminase n=1 Tax=Naganishia cerealis TaxID=610337 RepID=A0ACC2V337_9TREE|nr:AMP deaminase [Naganishia cerealis]
MKREEGHKKKSEEGGSGPFIGILATSALAEREIRFGGGDFGFAAAHAGAAVPAPSTHLITELLKPTIKMDANYDLADEEPRNFNSAHYSPTEDRFIKDHDLKVRTFEALHGQEHPSPVRRRQSVIDFPHRTFDLEAALGGGSGGGSVGGSAGGSSGSNIEGNTGDIETHPTPSAASHVHGSGLVAAASANAFPEEYASDELIELFQNVKSCLDTRHRYMQISVQDDALNPKNQDGWTIYPPPPAPTYKSKNRFNQVQHKNPEEEKFDFSMCKIPQIDDGITTKVSDEGVFKVYLKDSDSAIVDPPTLRDYYLDLDKINRISSDGPSKSFAFKRLEYLETKWNLYYLLNEFEENKKSKRNPHRDFYNVRKVDTHIHHSACMNQKHLLRYIKYKLKTCPDEQVIFRDGKILTLKEVFESLNLTGYDLSIDTLDMHAHTDTFHRFDKFNLKYNPIGESRLREIFLKTDNFINGLYLAELTQQVFEDLESSKYQMNELRISVYGRSISEWDKLAAWIVDNKLFSHNVRWLIQVPRLYDVYKKSHTIGTFYDIMRNLFEPLFEVLINPQSHPKLHVFLQRVVGFDSVDDELKQDRPFPLRKFPPCTHWDLPTNPPYSYYLYYLYANLVSLNQLRLRRGFNTLVLRPHCGEAGDPHHLLSAFLTAHSISHGILLRKVPFLQYLYFLDQIGLAMLPLSNNALFLTYDKNPFYSFFKRGMNVSLSTDDPLQFSYTKEPLIEEYSVAAQIYKLSSVDMCELARNSVLQSGWEDSVKKHWIGKNYKKRGVEGNDLEKTNVPDIRVEYREHTLQSELHLMNHYTGLKKSS